VIDRFRMDHCGFIFQGFNLFPALTALQQVEVVLKFQGLSKSDARRQATATLKEVGLGNRLHQRTSILSGGEKQRVAIARCLAKNPQILFADEPSANLDSATGRKIEDLLFELNKSQGTTLVLVTHNAQLAARCQRQFLMDAGRLTEAVPAAQELSHVG
jgi:putative ABC transport system ATP-binding protein